MENIKEELRQLTKNKILSAIMEAKKCDKCDKAVHAPRGAYQQKIKSFGKGGKVGTSQTQDRREGKKQAAQLDENEFVTLGALMGGLLGAGAVGLGVDALRGKIGNSRRIQGLKDNLRATQKTPTVRKAMSNEESDYNNQFQLHRDKLENRELQRARAEGRSPNLISPGQVHEYIQNTQNRGLSAVTKRTNKNLS